MLHVQKFVQIPVNGISYKYFYKYPGAESDKYLFWGFDLGMI